MWLSVISIQWDIIYQICFVARPQSRWSVYQMEIGDDRPEQIELPSSFDRLYDSGAQAVSSAKV